MNSGGDKIKFRDFVHEKWEYIQVIIIFFVVVSLMASIFTVDSTSKFIGIFTPLMVGGMTAWVAWNQFQLSKEQKEISKQQADIAKKNKKIAKNKLKLELFEKRYLAFEDFVEYFSSCHDLDLDISHYINLSPEESENYVSMHDRRAFIDPIYQRTLNEIKEIKSRNDESKIKLQVTLTRIIFLFNDNIHQILLKFSKDIHQYGNEVYELLLEELENFKDAAMGNSALITTDVTKFIEKRHSLGRRLHDEILKSMEPFLKIPK
ncbi:hypothetical protein AD952_14130 [Acetobacter cerevisiae]|uniref:Uncharacterized protein n=1 Tax=Acetobacter cerevisiae TaxID=178900 RepID=A0A149UPR7_9PROT|nr:hypothetical protein [Acetobacter cerevisiae]KXV69793.1 hypothetical protein AD952_14130 [Acetobacter cerevisiae]